MTARKPKAKSSAKREEGKAAPKPLGLHALRVFLDIPATSLLERATMVREAYDSSPVALAPRPNVQDLLNLQDVLSVASTTLALPGFTRFWDALAACAAETRHPPCNSKNERVVRAIDIVRSAGWPMLKPKDETVRLDGVRVSDLARPGEWLEYHGNNAKHHPWLRDYHARGARRSLVSLDPGFERVDEAEMLSVLSLYPARPTAAEASRMLARWCAKFGALGFKQKSGETLEQATERISKNLRGEYGHFNGKNRRNAGQKRHRVE